MYLLREQSAVARPPGLSPRHGLGYQYFEGISLTRRGPKRRHRFRGSREIAREERARIRISWGSCQRNSPRSIGNPSPWSCDAREGVLTADCSRNNTWQPPAPRLRSSSGTAFRPDGALQRVHQRIWPVPGTVISSPDCRAGAEFQICFIQRSSGLTPKAPSLPELADWNRTRSGSAEHGRRRSQFDDTARALQDWIWLR